MLKSFRQTVATPLKWPGLNSASSPSSFGSTQVRKPGGYSSSAAGAKTMSTPARLRDSRVALLVAGIAREVVARPELRLVDEEAHHDAVALGARGLEQRLVAGVERAHRRDEADRSLGRTRRAHLRDGADDLHGFVASASARYIGSSSGASSWIARTCASTVSQSPRAIGPVRSKPFSIVRVISGTSASGGAPAASKSRRRGAVQRHEVVRSDRRAGVVAPAVRRRRGRTDADPSVRASSCPCSRASSLSAVTAAQAPSSCSAPRERVNVCSGCSPNRRVCGSSARERRRAADVRDPLSRDQVPRPCPRSRVRNAEQDELRVVSQRDAALLEARGEGRTDAAASDDVDALEQSSSSLAGYRARAVYAK